MFIFLKNLSDKEVKSISHTDSEEVSVWWPVRCVDEVISNRVARGEGIENILPVGATKNKRAAI